MLFGHKNVFKRKFTKLILIEYLKYFPRVIFPENNILAIKSKCSCLINQIKYLFWPQFRDSLIKFDRTKC